MASSVRQFPRTDTTARRGASRDASPVEDREDSFDESLHALPGWFGWFQKTFGLTFLVVAEAYLLGNLAALGWVPDITFGTILGSFRGIGVVFFFLAGVAVAGIGLTCSVVFVGAVKRRQWFMALVTGFGCLIFFGVEVWASLSERSVNLHATPADLAVLAAFGFKGIPPISPTVVVVSILIPLGSLYFGFVQQRRAAVTALDIAEDEMEMRRKIRQAELQAQLNVANAQKNAAAAKGMVGVVRAGVQAVRGGEDASASIPVSNSAPTDPTDEQDEPDEDADVLADESDDDSVESTLDARRRRWEQMDALRARMVREGYPLTDLPDDANEAVWYSLAKRTRRLQLAMLLSMTPDAVEAAVAQVRRQRQATGKR